MEPNSKFLRLTEIIPAYLTKIIPANLHACVLLRQNKYT